MAAGRWELEGIDDPRWCRVHRKKMPRGHRFVGPHPEGEQRPGFVWCEEIPNDSLVQRGPDADPEGVDADGPESARAETESGIDPVPEAKPKRRKRAKSKG